MRRDRQPEPVGALASISIDCADPSALADLAAAVERAVALGAREGAHQAMPDRFRVMPDPEGHSFCLTTFTR